MAKNETPPTTSTGAQHDHSITVPQGQGNLSGLAGGPVPQPSPPVSTLPGGNLFTGSGDAYPGNPPHPGPTLTGSLIQGDGANTGTPGKDFGRDSIEPTQGSPAAGGPPEGQQVSIGGPRGQNS